MIEIDGKSPILVSACLTGVGCRYDGKEKNFNSKVMNLIKDKKVILVCPEVMGGLSTPRPGAGRDGDRVVTIEGTDVTEQYLVGATSVEEIAKLNGCKLAILKARSPSCGVGTCIGIETLRGGDYQNRDGVAAEKLRALGIKLIT